MKRLLWIFLFLGALTGRAEAYDPPLPGIPISARLMDIELLNRCIRAITPEAGVDEKRLADSLTKVLAYVSAGKGDEELDDANRALAAEPKSTIVLIYHAFAQNTKRHWYDAIKDLDAAIAADSAPKDIIAMAYYIHGEFSYHMSDRGVALKDSDRAIAMNPKLAPAYTMKGSLLEESTKYLEAADALDQGVALDPGEPYGYVARSNFRDEQGSEADALRDITRAIELNPRDPLPYWMRGRIYFYKHDHASADRDFDQAAKIFAEIEGQ
jgi:tetratricopeptide (TPR) repeat protein